MSTAAEDARARAEEWRKQGSPDYGAPTVDTAGNITGYRPSQGYAPPAPSAYPTTQPGPPAPSASPPWQPGMQPPQKPGDPGWDQRGQRVTKYFRAASEPGGAYWGDTPPTAPGVTGDGGVPTGVNANGLTPEQQAEIDYKNQQLADARKQNELINKLNQDKFDLSKAQADAINAYNQSMLQFNDRRLAQDAFDNSILAAYRVRQNELTAEAQQQTAAYQNQTLVLRGQEMRQNRRQLRPFRSARIRMVA